MQPPGFLWHPLSLILCVWVCVCLSTDKSMTSVSHRRSIYRSCSDSFGGQDEVDMQRGLPLDLYYLHIPLCFMQPHRLLPLTASPFHFWGGTNGNWTLHYSCKLTQSISVNPGLHAKTCSLENKESHCSPLCRTICCHQPPVITILFYCGKDLKSIVGDRTVLFSVWLH